MKTIPDVVNAWLVERELKASNALYTLMGTLVGDRVVWGSRPGVEAPPEEGPGDEGYLAVCDCLARAFERNHRRAEAADDPKVSEGARIDGEIGQMGMYVLDTLLEIVTQCKVVAVQESARPRAKAGVRAAPGKPKEAQPRMRLVD